MKRRLDILLPVADVPVAREWCWRDDWNLSGQSAFMLLARFQQLNAVSFTALSQLFLRTPDRWSLRKGIDLYDMRQFDLLRMSELMSMSLADVAAAFLPLSDFSRSADGRMLRWCASCATYGVHLAIFQAEGCSICPVHGCPLRERCTGCGETVMTYRLRAANFRAPFCCHHCGQKWARSPDNIETQFRHLSAAYRSKLAEGLARGWFGRRSRNIERLLRSCCRDHSAVWLSSAQQRGLDTDPSDGFCARVVLGQIDADADVLFYRYRRSSLSTKSNGESQDSGEKARPLLAVGAYDDVLEDAIACYKAIRRHLLRRYCHRHLTCIVTAARHLKWRLDGQTTTPFCPVAQAMLRWRTKWEGVGVPAYLLGRSEHGLLGVIVWLSLFSPVGLPGWSRADEHRVTLHVLALALLDSFACYFPGSRCGRQARITVVDAISSDGFSGAGVGRAGWRRRA